MKLKIILSVFVVFLLTFLLPLFSKNDAIAQSCGGSQTCCPAGALQQVCVPSNCDPALPGCFCSEDCLGGEITQSCLLGGGASCATEFPAGCDRLYGTCIYTPPAQTCNSNGICESGETSTCPDCTGGGGGGGGGGETNYACGGCDTCGQPAGRCAINPTTGVCEAPGYCGPAVSSCSATLSGPNVIQAGASGYFTAYGAGTPDDWYHVWTGDAYWLGTYFPGSGSGPNAATTYTPYTNADEINRTSYPFTTNVKWNVHEGDWTNPNIACTANKNVLLTAPAASCTVSIPNVTVTTGTSTGGYPSISVTGGSVSVTSVDYSSLNPTTASLSPTSTSASPYTTLITGNNTGVTSYTAIVNTSDGSSCTDTATITVTPPGAWWQVVGGDVMTNQALNSTFTSFPSSPKKFILNGAGGYPGNALFGTTSNLTNSNVSDKGWLAKSIYRGRTYDYDYFMSLTNGRVTFNTLPAVASQATLNSGVVSSDGYTYFKKDAGTLNINSDITIAGNQKVIIFSESTIHLNGNISIASPGQGFLMVISKGDINVATSVTTLQGIFTTDTTFNTGNGNTQLNVKGTVVAWTDVELERDLGGLNDTTPSETFTFDPALTLLFPRSLIRDSVDWKEVAP